MSFIWRSLLFSFVNFLILRSMKILLFFFRRTSDPSLIVIERAFARRSGFQSESFKRESYPLFHDEQLCSYSFSHSSVLLESWSLPVLQRFRELRFWKSYSSSSIKQTPRWDFPARVNDSVFLTGNFENDSLWNVETSERSLWKPLGKIHQKNSGLWLLKMW